MLGPEPRRSELDFRWARTQCRGRARGRNDVARRTGSAALPAPSIDRRDPVVLDERLDPAGHGESRPVELGRKEDELVGSRAAG